MTKVYDAVIRVSRKNGRGEDGGSEWLSPTQQLDEIDGYARKNGVRIASYFDETDSVSGKGENMASRVGLQAALDRALNGETDGIIVAKVDRFARSLVGGMTAIGKLDAAKRDFVAVKDGVGPDGAVSPTGRAMRALLFVFAQWQLENLTESWEDARRRHIDRGVAPVNAFGYRKTKGKPLEIDPETAPWVTFMFERRADGWSWVEIKDALNAAGVPTSRNAPGWDHTTIARLVENRTYLGEASSGEFVNPTAHPAIVTPELWARAQSRRKTTSRNAAQTYLLTGMVRCSLCGVRMKGQATVRRLADGTDKTYRSYSCRHDLPFGHCPGAKVNADEIETLVLAHFRKTFRDVELESEVTTDDFDAAIAERVSAEEDAADWFGSAARAELARRLGDAAAVTADENAIARVESARARENDARNIALGVSFPDNLFDVWETLNAEERRSFLAEAFDVIAVAGDSRSGPVAGRVRIFGREEARALTLPGVGGVPLDRPRPIPVGA